MTVSTLLHTTKIGSRHSDTLSELLGAHYLSTAEQHRESVRGKVFGLHSEVGSVHRTDAAAAHTLRAPDVGNRIDEGRLPQILSEALPPLSEQTLERPGSGSTALPRLGSHRTGRATTLEHVRQFHSAYRAYATTVLVTTATALDSTLGNPLDARDKHGELSRRLRGPT
ncbi:hypothetical protein AB0L63_29160 [Nocardia sp. NPDC051990]|uniref:hypothetical protein n=1 Tax=Nocardia sp. NPDC051990 TaxID=3155285 RepID=UPI00341FA639